MGAFPLGYGTLNALLFGTPSHVSRWALTVIWIARLLTLALLLRTYIVPSAVRILSKRVRVRSVSLRSIRGLYLHAGKSIWTVERIKLGLRWVSEEKTMRMTVTVEGLKVEVVKRAQRPKLPRRKRHARMPTLADLSPSPLLHYAWIGTTSLTSLLRRIIQPVTTKALVIVIRAIILALPTLTQVMEFRVDAGALIWPELGDMRLATHNAVLSTHIAFNQIGGSQGAVEISAIGSGVRLGPQLLKKLAWTWRHLLWSSRDPAWTTTQCSANVSLTVDEIVGFTEAGRSSNLDAPQEVGQ
jgi:hypothetical protein